MINLLEMNIKTNKNNLKIYYNMNLRYLNKTAILTIAIVAALNFAACNQIEENEEKETTRLRPVETKKVEITKMDDNVPFTGTVEPWEESHIASGAAMRIKRIFVDVDDYVRKGQLIAQMDETQLHQAQIRVNTLKDDVKRMDTLRKVGAVTQQSYEQLKAEYDIAKSSLENLSENTKIYSPLTGIVTGRYYSEGEIFSMSPGPAGKPAIVSVMQIQPVKVSINVSERYFPLIRRGMNVNIRLDMYPEKSFTGKVHRIYPFIDRTTGTFKVEVKVPNNERILRPGMYVRTNLNFGEKKTLIIPSQAVLRQSGSNERFIFVEEDGVALRKTVTLGERIDDMLEITDGLEQGDNLIVSGQHNLIHKQEVRVVE